MKRKNEAIFTVEKGFEAGEEPRWFVFDNTPDAGVVASFSVKREAQDYADELNEQAERD